MIAGLLYPERPEVATQLGLASEVTRTNEVFAKRSPLCAVHRGKNLGGTRQCEAEARKRS
jgi:hypothetical protein